MCGINGFYNFGSNRIPDAESLVRKMNDTLVHRGPDDSGVWLGHGGDIALGHRRLSILDLSEKGHQPMAGRRGTMIVYNGEIYNYRDIRKSFTDTEYLSDTDTEVLLRCYDESGTGMLDELNGMFAFSLWDENCRKLFLARDRIGIKPLYYTVANGIFSFSSEIRALLTLPWVNAELDEESLYHYLTFNKVSPPETMFKGINKFHPGYQMIVGENGIEEYASYWDLDYSQTAGTQDESVQDDVLDLLRDSVGYRMISDVPVGAFLSGGVDSSAIVALMSERTDKRVRTFSVGFDEQPDYDERKYALDISRKYNTEHSEKIVTRNDIQDFLPRIAGVFDEPLADATSIPIYFISEMAREMDTKVILTGDGADELFCGYSNWLPYQKYVSIFNAISRMPGPLRKAIRRMGGLLDENSPVYEIIARATSRQEFFWGGAGALKESAKKSILGHDYIDRMHSVDIHRHVESLRDRFDELTAGRKNLSYVDWMCFMGIKDIVPNYYLYRADRLGMANSIEIRVPFLDHRMVNLGMNIPGSLKIKNGEPKYILKKSLEGILPHETLYRRKMGFCVPLGEWMKDIVVGGVRDKLDRFCDNTGLLDRTAVQGLVEKSRQGDPNVVHVLWNIYFLIEWHDQWMQ